MIVIGLTGGIASGKTNASQYLKTKRFAVHESDLVVKKIYSKAIELDCDIYHLHDPELINIGIKSLFL